MYYYFGFDMTKYFGSNTHNALENDDAGDYDDRLNASNHA